MRRLLNDDERSSEIRTVLGLRINKDGDIIGLSPSDGEDMDNWSHQ